MFQSLYNWISKYPGKTIPQNFVIRMAKEICMGMNYLHSLENPIIHGDLKSLNILVRLYLTKLIYQLDKDLNIKITDFGLSRMPKTSSNLNNQTYWTAPECWDGSVTKGIESDVFSFGVILWELLTKRHPWETFTGPNQLKDLYFNGKTLPIPSHIPKKFTDILQQCWQFGNFVLNCN